MNKKTMRRRKRRVNLHSEVCRAMGARQPFVYKALKLHGKWYDRTEFCMGTGKAYVVARLFPWAVLYVWDETTDQWYGMDDEFIAEVTSSIGLASPVRPVVEMKDNDSSHDEWPSITTLSMEDMIPLIREGMVNVLEFRVRRAELQARRATATYIYADYPITYATRYGNTPTPASVRGSKLAYVMTPNDSGLNAYQTVVIMPSGRIDTVYEVREVEMRYNNFGMMFTSSYMWDRHSGWSTAADYPVNATVTAVKEFSYSNKRAAEKPWQANDRGFRMDGTRKRK